MKLFVAGVVFIWSFASAHAMQPDGGNWPELHTREGKTIRASHKLRFPLMLETSSLTWDSSDGSFYTTIDKGTPHIVQFRLNADSIEIIRAGEIVGMDQNYDFEGIDIAHRIDSADLLYISTERLWKNDSLRIWAIEKESWKIDSANSMSILPIGTGQNNNSEGIAVFGSGFNRIVGKERDPASIDGYDDGEGGSGHMSTSGERFTSLISDSLTYFSDLDKKTAKTIATFFSISALAVDEQKDRLYILNRYGRSIVLSGRSDVCFGVGYFSPTTFYTYTGIDFDDFTKPGISDHDKYGLAEGLALCVVSGVRSIAIITDPGAGAFPTLVIFPHPEVAR